MMELEELTQKTFELQCSAINGSPTDDQSVMHFIAQDSEGSVHVYHIANWNDEVKPQILSALRTAFRVNNVMQYAVASEAWSAKRPTKDPRPEVMPRDDPQRQDILICAGVHRDGRIIFKTGLIIVADDGKRHVDPTGEDDYKNVGGALMSLFTTEENG